MSKPKMMPIQVSAAKSLVRLLERLDELSCVGCTGGGHDTGCPAAEAFQHRNYLTQRINNPTRNFTV